MDYEGGSYVGLVRHLTLALVVLREIATHSVRVCINFATTDFEKLCDKLPKPVDDLARIRDRYGPRRG